MKYQTEKWTMLLDHWSQRYRQTVHEIMSLDETLLGRENYIEQFVTLTYRMIQCIETLDDALGLALELPRVDEPQAEPVKWAFFRKA